MNKDSDLQINFLNQLKDLIPPKNTLVDELADILQVSPDSIYRRIRGETALTINEVSVLCNHFKISFDIFADNSKNITFNYDSLGNTAGFENYLNSILNDMLQIAKAKEKQIIYAAIDIPIFHHFNYPELSAFKMFYWMKAVVNVSALDDKKFDVRHISQEFAQLGSKIYETYCNIPSIEIWTDETINSLIKQIEFFWDIGNFASKNDALTVCEQAKNEIDTLRKQAEISNKIINGTGKAENAFAMYHSDIEIGSNYIFTKKAEVEAMYLSIHTFNKIITVNKRFVDDTKNWLDNLMKKSNPISGVSQIHRYKFFKRATDKLEKLTKKIEMQ